MAAAHIGAGASAQANPALLHLILDVLDDNKAEETVVIDLRGKSVMADEMVIATGRSNRHVGAIADKLVEAIKAGGHGKCVVEGLPHCDWVLIDAGDVIVHLFRPEVRAFYNLEKMWSAGRPVEGLSGADGAGTMRLLVAAVGRLKAGPERELVARYVERCGQIGRGVALSEPEIVELDESRARSAHERKRDEAMRLIAAIPEKFAVVALDEGGRTITSETFAADLGRRRDDGLSGLAFAIGGADGHGPELLARADAKLAFGAMTWPHQIVRLLLAEQLYRAATILAGHPYHRA